MALLCCDKHIHITVMPLTSPQSGDRVWVATYSTDTSKPLARLIYLYWTLDENSRVTDFKNWGVLMLKTRSGYTAWNLGEW